ncbi:MAG: pyruvate kinase [Gemmatimonadota bacterium]
MSTGIRRTKIVATLGPAWSTPKQMTALLDAGVNVVRINASHATPAIREQWIVQLKDILSRRRDAAAILVDLQGPRIRVGDLATPRHLEKGSEVVFAPEAIAKPEEIPTTYELLARDVHTGARILLDDGLLEVTVTAVQGDRVRGKVVYGGELKSHKGMNLPGIEVSAPALTDRDREEIVRAVRLGVDFIALSFVRRGADMEELRALVPKTIKLIAKIEKDTAIKNLTEIIAASDAIMVARGDLGVELPFEEVPLMQKRLIRESNLQGKTVITATQMLESMVHAPRPTRAEASDVANAILDGTDAVMLSAETAVGEYPVEAVRAMDRIARQMEPNLKGRSAAYEAGVGYSRRRGTDQSADAMPPIRTEDAIGLAVCVAAELLATSLIVCFTSSGFTARKVAAYRPAAPIFAVTPEPETFRHLALVWGVVPTFVDHMPTYDSMLEVARQRILEQKLAEPGEAVVVTAGVPFDTPGTTNLLKVEHV